jgi:hypothetical protein
MGEIKVMPIGCSRSGDGRDFVGADRGDTATSIPIGTGWNDSCRAGFEPAEDARLCTAHSFFTIPPAGDPAEASDSSD